MCALCLLVFGLLNMNPTLPELTLFMKQESHGWSVLNSQDMYIMLSPHSADPTLTTDNLMEVVKEVEHQWKDLGHKLDLRTRTDIVGDKVQTQLSGVHAMADVVDEYVRRYPAPSWKKVATALQEMELDKLADEVTTKHVRGTDVNHVT